MHRVDRLKKCGFVCVSSNGRSSRMAFWRDINVVIKSFSSHHLDTEVNDHTNRVERKAARVYEWPERKHKYIFGSI